MKIRLATEADLPQLVAVSEAADSAAHWTQRQWLDIFSPDAPSRSAWVAEEQASVRENARIAGFLVAQTGAAQYGSEWELENIAVLPEYRRRGVARELMSVLLAEARQHRAERILLEVRESNVAAVRLYRATGFQEQGKRPDYYLNPVEDALIMVHTL